MYGGFLVGAEGFEPTTSSASGKRSPPELSALGSGVYQTTSGTRGDDRNRTGVTGFADPRLNHSATSPEEGRPIAPLGAEDGIRTRDLNLGKVALYQLSYFRTNGRQCNASARDVTMMLNGRSSRNHPQPVTRPEVRPPRQTPAGPPELRPAGRCARHAPPATVRPHG